MEIPKPQTSSLRPEVKVGAVPTGFPQTSRLGRRSTKTSASIVIGLIFSMILLGVAYLVFIKPETGPGAVLLARLFPAQSGIAQLQEIELDFDTILNSSVFMALKRHGQPIQIPPLGKPNPFF